MYVVAQWHYAERNASTSDTTPRGARVAKVRSNQRRRLPRLLLAVALVGGLSLAPPDASASSAQQLRRYPYLTDVVGTYATINWATDRSATTGSVRYGVAGSGSCTTTSVTATSIAITVNGVAEYQWKAMLSLTANTRYCYRVYLGITDLLGSDPPPTFFTQLPARSTAPFSFAVFGDWGSTGSSGSNTDQANLMARIAASGARFAVTVGDNAYQSGSQANYGDLRQTGSNLSGVYGPVYWTVPGRSIPLFAAIGNHGFASGTVPHPHLVNWPQDRALAASAGRYRMDTYCCLDGTSSASYPSAWYAFDVGVARLYVLEASWTDGNVGSASAYKVDHDYHWTAGSPEYVWLKNDLAAHPAGLKLAFFHYPLYSDNAGQTSDSLLQGAGSLEGLLGQYGVKIAFTGHAHIYERNKPNQWGMVSYVTGGGGAHLYTPDRCSSWDAYAIGWSVSSNTGKACHAPVPTSASQVFHFLLVSVNGNSVTVTPTDEMGRTFDVQTYAFG
jgi:hypothetical protein